jgi:hypothetical protein
VRLNKGNFLVIRLNSSNEVQADIPSFVGSLDGMKSGAPVWRFFDRQVV